MSLLQLPEIKLVISEMHFIKVYISFSIITCIFIAVWCKKNDVIHIWVENFWAPVGYLLHCLFITWLFDASLPSHRPQHVWFSNKSTSKCAPPWEMHINVCCDTGAAFSRVLKISKAPLSPHVYTQIYFSRTHRLSTPTMIIQMCLLQIIYFQNCLMKIYFTDCYQVSSFLVHFIRQ